MAQPRADVEGSEAACWQRGEVDHCSGGSGRGGGSRRRAPLRRIVRWITPALAIAAQLTCGDGTTEPAPDPNRAPEPAGAIAPREVAYGASATVNLAGHFRDPDGDPLAFAATSSDPGVATAAVSGSVVTVQAVSRGVATIAATATDPGGLSARQTFEVSVPNRGPGTTGAIADQQLEVGDSVTLSVAAHFTDPEGDPLVFSAASSDTSVARAESDGVSVLLVAVAKGQAVVTVTARDPGGGTAKQSFSVTVPNRAPFVADRIPGDSVLLGDTIEVHLTAYFEDPDGDSLAFSAESSEPGIATAEVFDRSLLVVPVAPGRATMTVITSDPEGLSATQSFGVTVVHPNRPPVAVGEISDRNIYVGTTDSLDVSDYFSDPDRDSLSYTASTSRRIRVAVAAHGNIIVLTAVSEGSSTITVTARDPDGLPATQRFRAVVEPVPAPDLVVDTVTVDRDSVEVRGEFTLSAIVRNQGEGKAATSTTLRFFHSSNPRITSTDSLLGSHPVGHLDTAATTAGSLTVRGPSAPGTHYYGACVVALENESDTGNNCSRALRVRVWQPNRAPQTVDSIPGAEVARDDSISLSLGEYFRDPDGDPLTFAASSSASEIAAAAITGDVVTAWGVSRGTATVTVIATDPGGLSAQQELDVTVPNGAPVAVGKIADRTTYLGATDSLDVSSHFRDPDTDSLAYTASTSSGEHVTVAVRGSTIALTAVSIGNAKVTVIASDPEGLSAAQGFQARVEPVPAPDLVVDRPSVDRDSVELGGEFTLSAVVRNRGNAEAQSTNALRVYESFDSTITAGDREVGRDSVMALGAGEASEVSVHVTGLSEVVTRYYGACVDASAAETSTGNNCSAGVAVNFLEPNSAPEPEGNIRVQSLEPGHAIRIELSSYFRDPDGDSLAYAAESSDTTVARASIRRGSVIVDTEALGSATITVTARDVTTRPPGSLTATQQFEVTVRLRPRPDLVIDMTQDSFAIGPEQTFLANAVVRNEGRLDVASGQTVRFYISSDTTIDASDSEIDGTATTIGAVPEGGHRDVSTGLTSPADEGVYYYGACVSTVADESRRDNNCSGALIVVVDELRPANRAPSADKTFEPVTNAEPGERYHAPLEGVFSDPDGDPLTITAQSSDDAVARTEIANDSIFVYTIAAGTATITVIATDPGGLSATTNFDVTVLAPCSGFCILLGFSGTVADVYKPEIRNAAGFWEAILAETELPDMDLGVGFKCVNLNLPDNTQVDDHLFIAHVWPIDGPGGTLASAGFCAQRDGGGFPTVSRAVFDAADIGELVAGGMLDDVAFHELAHGLGFIRGRLNSLGLTSDATEPHFTGSGALAAFNAAGGTGYTGAKVPMAPDLSHWSESVFDVEIMTPLLERGVPQPVSAITLQAFADLGYTVNASLANEYTLPTPRPPLLAAEQPHRIFDLSGDVDQGPVMILGPDGRVVDVIPPRADYAAPTGPTHNVTIDLRSRRPVREPPESLGPLDPAAAASDSARTAASLPVSWIRESYPVSRRRQSAPRPAK